MAATVYHVAGAGYRDGDDLLCWDLLAARGLVAEADWRWVDAPVGYDGDVSCVFDSLDEARDYRDEFGGRILAIEPDDADAETERTTVAEGFTCYRWSIPAAWVAGEVAAWATARRSPP